MTAETTVLRVRARRADARCPACRTVSRAPHSTYIRRPADLPSLGRRIRLELAVRRFYCVDATCSRRTFAEQLPGLLDVRARRTRRLAAAQRAVAVAVGAEAGARLAVQLAMPVSADSLLRFIRRAPLPTRPPRSSWVSTNGRSGAAPPTARSSSIWRRTPSSISCPTARRRPSPRGSAASRPSR